MVFILWRFGVYTVTSKWRLVQTTFAVVVGYIRDTDNVNMYFFHQKFRCCCNVFYAVCCHMNSCNKQQKRLILLSIDCYPVPLCHLQCNLSVVMLSLLFIANTANLSMTSESPSSVITSNIFMLKHWGVIESTALEKTGFCAPCEKAKHQNFLTLTWEMCFKAAQCLFW